MKSNTGWIIAIVILLAIIGVMVWLLFGTPATQPAPQIPLATSTPNQTPPVVQPDTPKPDMNQPLSKRVVVASPVSGAKVAKTFTVSGKAPGSWYFEAVFPIQVRDANNNVIGRGQGQAQGDWMTTELVAFTATVTTSGYTGPATLVLLRDNPSGLPENDDSVSVPIVIQ